MAPVPTLNIRGLHTHFFTYGGEVEVLSGVDLEVMPGEFVGVVGESGSGKSVLARSIIGLLPDTGRVVLGSVELNSRDILQLSENELQEVRGRDVTLIVSNPRAQLNPLISADVQLANIIRENSGSSKRTSLESAKSLLQSVGIPLTAHGSLPHELSGGMCQRVVISAAIANSPRLIIADEPTGGLDVTIQRQILDLIQRLVKEQGLAALIMTRDLGIVAKYCERVLVLRDGQVVESAPVSRFFKSPQNSYSKQLLRHALASGTHRTLLGSSGREKLLESKSLPADGQEDGQQPGAPLPIEVRHLVKHFSVRGSREVVHAVNDVSFFIVEGETLALIGESGSGKTTVGRCVAQLISPTSGDIHFRGRLLTNDSSAAARGDHSRIQMVFQEPTESLNPRLRLGASVEEPLLLVEKMSPADRRIRVEELFEMVRIDPRHSKSYPHQLSGGELQRICIARAIATSPDLVVLDEPTSSLDLSVRRGVIDLLIRLQEELRLSYLFISHDLTAVREIAHRVAIMYLGKIVEVASAKQIFRRQLHPYGMALLSSAFIPDPDVIVEPVRLTGEIPSPVQLPPGCGLHQRCPFAVQRCAEDEPELEQFDAEREASCWRVREIEVLGPHANPV